MKFSMLVALMSVLGLSLAVNETLWAGGIVLFALLVLEDLQMQQAVELQTIVSITVLMSIVLHGMTAGLFGRLYADWAERETSPNCPENIPMQD